ncbi:MAG: hypothetical protein P8102_09720 [Gammaproteobacteria bacterium]
MKDPNSENKGWLDRKENVERLWRALVFVCVILLALDFLSLAEIWHKHVSFFLEGLLGFYPLWGFTGIVLLIVLAKKLRKLVMRRENYYERPE